MPSSVKLTRCLSPGGTVNKMTGYLNTTGFYWSFFVEKIPDIDCSVYFRKKLCKLKGFSSMV